MEARHLEFKRCSIYCSERSEVCRYWEILVDLTTRLNHLIVADRDGGWEAHLRAVPGLLPISREYKFSQIGFMVSRENVCPSNRAPRSLPAIHRGQVVVQTSSGNFSTVSPDMKLEQTIQDSKSQNGIIGQSSMEEYITVGVSVPRGA